MSEPDIEEGQLSAADTLEDRGLDDALDEGYSPPEKPRGVTAFGVTPAEEIQGESLDQRLAQEEADDADQTAEVMSEDERYDQDEAGEFFDENEVGDERAGRLVAPDEGFGTDDDKDEIGEDVGIDGGAASAEEAAIHVIDPE
jgi:Family of unknown function (DUF5709)